MRIKITIALLLIGFQLIAQDTIIDTRNQLELIADELEISENQAFDTLVYQQKVMAYRNIMIIFTMLLSGFFFKKFLHNTQHKRIKISDNRYRDDQKEIYDNKWVVLTVVTGFIFVGSFIYNSIVLPETFTGLLNPEYGALEQLNFLNK